MSVKSRLLSSLPLYLILVDPEKCKKEVERQRTIRGLKSINPDSILVGGTANLDALSIVDICRELKEIFKIPIISFLRDSSEVNPFVDAALAPMVFNSRNMWFVRDNFFNCVDNIQEMGVELLTLAYIVQPGNTSVSFAVDPLPIYGRKPILRKYARVINAFRFDFAYLEGGSGAEQSISLEIISNFKKELNVPLLVGGGITTSSQAKEIIKAGADGVVVGTLFEEGKIRQVRNMIKAIKKWK